MEELDYQRALQAARVVAGMGNLQRKKGSRALRATDMVRRASDRPKPEDFEHLRHCMAPSGSIRE